MKPRLLLIGGPDVDARLDLMESLRADFELSAAGSEMGLAARFASAGFSYYYYPLNRGVSPSADLVSAYRLWLLCRAVKPDIVHTFDPKPSVWGRLAAKWAHVPVIIGTLPGLGSLYASDTALIRFVRALYQPLQTWACAASDLTIFQNHSDARQFIAAGVVAERKTRVIPGSGVPTEVFSRTRITDAERANVRAALGLQSGALVVTMISRVIRSKGIPEFVAAAHDLRARYPHVKFVLIGPADNESLDRLTEAELAQLQQAIHWPGPRRDVPAILAVSDIFVLPTAYREGIPRVLLEAASMGLPLITTDSPGCNEVVEHGVNGYLVPIHDAVALREALVQLIEQPALRQQFGRQSRQRVVERFDLGLIVEHSRAVYHQFLAHSANIPV